VAVFVLITNDDGQVIELQQRNSMPLSLKTGTKTFEAASRVVSAASSRMLGAIKPNTDKWTAFSRVDLSKSLTEDEKRQIKDTLKYANSSDIIIYEQATGSRAKKGTILGAADGVTTEARTQLSGLIQRFDDPDSGSLLLPKK
jgi:hypothetical protein